MRQRYYIVILLSHNSYDICIHNSYTKCNDYFGTEVLFLLGKMKKSLFQVFPEISYFVLDSIPLHAMRRCCLKDGFPVTRLILAV